MGFKDTDLLSEVAQYYSAKIIEHGETPRGVDWNGEESQVLRFQQLSKIIDAADGYTIADLGCGYGAMLTFLDGHKPAAAYQGVDVSENMISAAQKRFSDRPDARFIRSSSPDGMSDFSVASGILNVRLGRSDEEWFGHLQNVLDVLDQSSRHGFAFNCLTSYSDEDKKRDYLYYADPCKIFDICKRKYSKQVAVLHDYGLYEFTVLVRKEK